MNAVFEQYLGKVRDTAVLGQAQEQIDILDRVERTILADCQYGVATHHERGMGDRCVPLALKEARVEGFLIFQRAPVARGSPSESMTRTRLPTRT